MAEARPRKRKVLFCGGAWNGQFREIVQPLPERLFVAVGALEPAAMRATLQGIPPWAAPYPVDVYHLETFTDGTGIPEKRYRLREMVRHG